MNELTNKDKYESIKNKYLSNIPVDVIALAEELGIDVYEVFFDNDNVSGYISTEDNKPFICVNKRHPSTRQYFTIAHEIGHFVLHQDILDNNITVPTYYKTGEGINNCVMARSSIEFTNSIEYKRNETQANQFAANLLMPKDEFIKQANLCDNLIDLAQIFKVSVGAASIRANSLGIEFF